MKNIITIFAVFVFLSILSNSGYSQTFCSDVAETAPSGPTKFAIKVSLVSVGMPMFEIGSSNLVLDYNNTGLANPVLVVGAPFNNPPFTTVNVTNPFDPGIGNLVASLNIVYAFDGTPGFGNIVNNTPTEVATIEFDILNPNLTSGITWVYDGTTSGTVVNITAALQIFADSPACLLGLDAPLPIELISFDVHKKGEDNAQVTWQTASEQNVSHYEVERSFEGTTWEKVGVVSAEGNSYETTNYQFEDNNLKRFIDADQRIYYRLKSVDYDQSFEHSQVKSIEINIDQVAISVYPNPTVDGVQVTVHSAHKTDELTATLKDIHGKDIMIHNLGDSKMINQYLSFDQLPTGTYFLTFESDNKVYTTERLIIMSK